MENNPKLGNPYNVQLSRTRPDHDTQYVRKRSSKIALAERQGVTVLSRDPQ